MESQDYLNSTASAWQAWFMNALKGNKQTIISVTVGVLVIIVAWKFHQKRMSNNGEKGKPEESNDKTRSEESTSSKKEKDTTSKRKSSVTENGESSDSEENLNDDKIFSIGKEEKKITVIIKRGDITNEVVDVIVNAANGRLQHGGGVARAIAVKAGKDIDREGQKKLKDRGSALNVSEVLHTQAFNLKAKYVLHAVGPIYQRGRDSDFKSCLEKTFKNCLEYKDYEEHDSIKSIAVPLISSGIFGGQKNACADALYEAVNEFAEKETINSIKEIRLVNIDAEATDAIKASFSKFEAGQSAS